MNKLNNPEIIYTEDGSHTLFVPELKEHYHSTYGAIQESRHVYLKEGLKYSPANPVIIFEVGFGTGLNALLTLLYANESKRFVNYSSIELFPVSNQIVKKLNYSYLLEAADSFNKLHEAEWNKTIKISEYFSLHKINADLTSYELDVNSDVVYFDAFAPNIQPEMWTEAIFNKLFQSMNKDGILTTYSSKGKIKRIMQDAGFHVEKIAGPPGKREMLRGIKL
jgi:tRNA U34 5-methylaminomethyl-2-thiouridine-forming methyltransferase MnmC